MKYKIKQSSKTQKAIEFHISKEVIAGELDRIYREISKTATLPGFRSGKVPADLIRKRYVKEAQEEAVRNLMHDSFKKAITESQIKMLGGTEIADLVFDEQKGMSYKAVVNIKPEIKLKSYKGLELKKNGKEVKESDIDAEVNKLREMSAKFVTKDKSAVKGDYIICDVDCTVENNPVEKKKNAWLFVGEGTFIPGEPLEGMKAGDEKDLEKALPKDYSKKEIAGKDASFHIKAKEVKEKILPELDEEFLSTMGKFKSTAEFREVIRGSLKGRNEVEERRGLESQALKILDKAASFDVPQFMVERHHQMLIESTKKRLKREQFSDDQIASMEKDFTERLKGEALREIRVYFILSEIARLEELEIEDKELEEAFNAISASSGRSIDDVKKHYQKNDTVEDLKEEIKQRKVLDFLIKNANIK
ncbi:MAG: trigger factor [Candidatus Omnitrophica bacterium]|nr:trigger factor [Candidatus Omnitrophota bacterium]